MRERAGGGGKKKKNTKGPGFHPLELDAGAVKVTVVDLGVHEDVGPLLDLLLAVLALDVLKDLSVVVKDVEVAHLADGGLVDERDVAADPLQLVESLESRVHPHIGAFLPDLVHIRGTEP